jgi:hypothetical protein
MEEKEVVERTSLPWRVTDKEIVGAIAFIKEQNRGTIPDKVGVFECACMLANYLIIRGGKLDEVRYCQNCNGENIEKSYVHKNKIYCHDCAKSF